MPEVVDCQSRWCNRRTVALEGPANVVRFPRECPKCHLTTAMPSKAGTLAKGRTQMDLRCDKCRHEWTIEMSPPVLIVNPARQTDSATSSSQTPVAQEEHEVDRRHLTEMNARRMRVGLRGLLSGDGALPVSVLYSLDADRARGRLRPLDPGNLFPSWLALNKRLKLSGDDGVTLVIRITAVQIPPAGRKDDEYFAGFIVRQARQ